MLDNNADVDIVDCNFTDIELAVSNNFSDRVNTINCSIVNANVHGFQFWGRWGDWESKNASDLVFSGNHITNGGAGAIWGAGAKRITMTNNYVDGAADVGLDVEFWDDVVITGNTVKRCRYGGIAAFFSSEGVLIEDNVVYNDRVFGTGQSSAGIWLTSLDLASNPGDIGHSYVVIRDNEVILGSGPEKRFCIAIGSVNDTVLVYNNTLDPADPYVRFNTLSPQIWDATGNFVQVAQPVTFDLDLPGKMRTPPICADLLDVESQNYSLLEVRYIGDLDDDCDVDMSDLALFAGDWLNTNDMSDFALFAEDWLKDWLQD